RLIVVTGKGPDFSSGADISEFEELRATPEGARRYDAMTESAYDAIRNARLPTLAAIRGACIGGGFGLAMACDIRIAQNDAIFAIPAARLGLAYPVNSLAHITSVVGPATAKDMLFTARRLTAEEALNAGILSAVTPQDIDELVRKYVQQIAANAPLSVRAAKIAIDGFAGAQPTDPIIRAQVDACYESADYIEGRTAFVEKRAPKFSGK
ncbi:MAG: enoyl-CoA hydratase/isomerase family protein, partial [Fimbriimonadaceae bacterium]|nr:enoyl-CoA hydratase/isomerase family protein [Alphaproteobacteria bacterium]